jgi:histidinol-phosphatase (PHP family)
MFKIEAGNTISELLHRHKSYITEAQRLRAKYASQITLLIGFEGEWIRPSSAALIRELLLIPGTEFFIGSVHHVHTIPIDYDRGLYLKAREAAGGTDERLFEDYFDAQFEMLENARPTVVGHFDLIRLLCDNPNVDEEWGRWKGAWERVERNLRKVVEIDGLLEVNSSALRKGLREPYPGKKICQVSFKVNWHLATEK